FQRKTKSGKTIWLRGIYNPIMDMNGMTKKVIKFAVDITEEKRLQFINQRKQKELNSYLEGINNTIASAEFEPDGRFQGANDIFLKVMGYESTELKGKAATDLLGNDPAMVMMWENLRLGQFFSGEFKLRNKSGKELWLSGTFNPLTIDGDKPEKILMFAQFTTQEKEKMNDLNTLVLALKSTLPIVEFNADYSCKTANEKAMKLFGWSRLELRNKTMLDLIDPSYHPLWIKKKDETLAVDFSTLALPFRVNELVAVYNVSISISHNLDGSIGKVILILVNETANQGYALAAN
ncbi:MAG: PAS domain S-box protein, partial [Cytophagales bacterium]|nr:PAS domain S-box protein [Cytophagales bacterium]